MTKKPTFGSIGTLTIKPQKPGTEANPDIGPETSQCGSAAFVNAKDAPGVKACWLCGNYHKK